MGKENKILSGLSWSFAEKLLTDVIGTVVTIVLARYLYPEDYGIVALVQVFINISLIFVDCGMCTALIQKKDATQEEISTIFYLNLFLGIFIYVVIYTIAPFLSSIKGNQDLVNLLRVLAIRIPIASVYSIQHAQIQKNMQFKKFFFSSLFGTLLSGIVGVSMAIYGFGAWSLVVSNLIDQSFDCFVLFLTTRWLPKFKIDIKQTKEMLFFGLKILFVELITRLATNLRSLIIGFKYNSEDLAFNSKGQKYPQTISNLTNSVVTRVMFPVLSDLQNEKDKMRKIVEKNVEITSFILVPMMVGFLSVANKIVPLLLTEKWNGAIIYIQIYCLANITIHISSVCTRVIQACGEGNYFIKMQTTKIIADYIIIAFALIFFNSPLAVSVSVLVSQLIDVCIDIYSTNHFIGYGYNDVIKDTYKTLFSSIIMGIIVVIIGNVISNNLLSLVVQVVAGVAVYFIMAFIFKNECLGFVVNYIKGDR